MDKYGNVEKFRRQCEMFDLINMKIQMKMDLGENFECLLDKMVAEEPPNHEENFIKLNRKIDTVTKKIDAEKFKALGHNEMRADLNTERDDHEHQEMLA